MKFSLFTVVMLAFACFWIYDGFQRGARYYSLLTQSPQEMIVSRAINLNGRKFFPNYVAIGSVSNVDSPVVVEIFQDQFLKMRHGGRVDVYQLNPPAGTAWVNRAKFEESKPIYNLLGLRFSYHVLLGLFFIGCACFLAYMRQRQIDKVLNRLLNRHSSPAGSAEAPPTGPAK
jgi:hypothetical protein